VTPRGSRDSHSSRPLTERKCYVIFEHGDAPCRTTARPRRPDTPDPDLPMARVFNRGELKQALLSVIASLGEGHGYAIMQELQRRVGSQWRPSPGAIYPALVALEGAGLISSTEQDGLRTYRLTEEGAVVAGESDAAPSWRDISRRADARRPLVTLGRLLDRFELGLPRRTGLSPEQAESIDAALTRTRSDIVSILEQGAEHG
jgi:DNA-binding PadR family transcriptional regulator